MTPADITARYPLPAGLAWEQRGDRWMVVASPWTMTIPTEPGYYLVWPSPGVPPQVWELTEDPGAFVWLDAQEVFHTAKVFPPGCQFHPCPMPPAEWAGEVSKKPGELEVSRG